jgi:O-antigen ligase
MALVGGIIVLTGSRAAAVAVVTGLGLIVWLRLRARGRPMLTLAVVSLLLALGVILAYGDLLYATLDRFYALSAADRGISSGATGRITAWRATWDLFTRNPVLGVGFRAHEHLLKVDTSAHNGYLATLAEVGILGFIGVGYLTVRGLNLLLAGSSKPDTWFRDSVLFGLCVAYLLLALFERYLINVGNPTSLLFLLSIMRPREMEAPASEPDELLRDRDGEASASGPFEPVYGVHYR